MTHAVVVGVMTTLIGMALLSVMPRVRLSSLTVGVMTVFLLTALPSGASAQTPTVENLPGQYTNVTYCLWDAAWPGIGGNGTTLGHGSPRMDSQAGRDGNFNAQGQYAPCSDPYARWQTGTFFIVQNLMYWVVGLQAWTHCNDGPKAWNQANQHIAFTGYGWPSTPCGAGYYREELWNGTDYVNMGPRTSNYTYSL